MMAYFEISTTHLSVTKTYIVTGAVMFTDSKTQKTLDLNLPQATEDFTKIIKFFGQNRKLALSFLLMERSDDYSDGTHAVGSAPYSISSQRTYLMSTIFNSSQAAQMTFRDSDGIQFEGAIENLEIVNNETNPLYREAVLIFKVGDTT